MSTDFHRVEKRCKDVRCPGIMKSIFDVLVTGKQNHCLFSSLVKKNMSLSYACLQNKSTPKFSN